MQWPSAAINHVAVWAVNGAGGRQDSSRFPNLLRAASPTARKPGTTPGTCRSPPRGHGGFLLLPSAAAGADILPVHPWLCSCLWLPSPRGDPSAAARAGAAAQGLVPAGGRWDVRGARPAPAAREGRGWSQSLWLHPCGSLWRLMPAPGQGSQVRVCSRAGITGTFLNTPLHPRGLPGAPREGGREPGGQSGTFCFCCSSSKVFSIPLDVLWGQRELLCLWRGSPCPFAAGSTKKWEMGNSRGAVPEGGDPET